MKNFVKTALILGLIVTFTSCAFDNVNKIQGNQNVIEKSRKITGNFTKIKASNGLDVFISEDKNAKIIVEADENLHEVIKTEIENETLKIYTEKGIWRAKSKKIYVSLPVLEAVSASSGSDVITEDFFTSENFDAKVSSGADLLVRIKAKSISASSSSGADLELIGKAENAELSSSSGSDLDAFELIAKNVIAKASSGSNLDAYATKSITAKSSSGSDIDFKGNPEIVDKKSSSGGSVSKK